jgi:hypothetical protein
MPCAFCSVSPCRTNTALIVPSHSFMVFTCRNYQESPMRLAVIQAAAQMTDTPELHDCFIAGTARRLNPELIINELVQPGLNTPMV